MPISHRETGGIAEVTLDFPPVNALPADGWLGLADLLARLGGDAAVRVVILSAEGRGFCAGVDIKEIQAEKAKGQAQGHQALLRASRGCFAAFAGVYECPVPVIAAVQGHCLGGGIGLVGNADIIVASRDAFFGLPEVDRGALGAATHLSRLVPHHRMRQMVYTGARASADELLRHGSVARVVERGELAAAARELASDIAQKSPTIVRAAKQSLNGIDPIDVRKNYRFEQGFTFELTLDGVADEARAAFVEKRDPRFER